MLTYTARALLAEPRAPNPPARGPLDWALVAVLVPATILEGIFREDVAWPAVSVIAVVAVLPLLLWRRTHPLLGVAVGFGTFSVVDAASIVAGVEWEGLNTGASVLLLVYALFRWGSGREAAIGSAIMLTPVLLSATGRNPVGDVVGGIFILTFVAAIGTLVRYQNSARTRGMDQVKLREREQLARELHDTVAHHVSAIAVQAQAGRTVAASRPDAALGALGIIEEEASRTLAEMRTMVSALRQGEEPDLAPQRGVADIPRLAGTTGNGLRIDVELSGDLDGLWPSLDAALYRLAQESITNALRHARHATRVHVRVTGDDDCVRLVVSDDGHASAVGAGPPSGYGLVGMTERAHLLGGTLEAGPDGDGGWTVRAVLPRSGASA